MQEMDAKIGQMREWVAQLNAAADAYYNGRGELMTDFEWDELFDRVKALEAETGVVLPDSPTNKVSADSGAGQKEPHEFAALSLAKTKRVDEVAKWAEGRPIWISWKLDGLTLVVTYDDGRLTKVVTRGDGHVGTNITDLADGLFGIPKTVNCSGHLVVRGEAVISYRDFERFIQESEEDFANPRNLAAGSLSFKLDGNPEKAKQKIEDLRQRNIQWIPFTLVHAEKEILSWGTRMEYLQEIGLAHVEMEKIEDPTVENIQATIDRWTQNVTTGVNPYPVDGLVVCYDDTEYAKTGSVTGHHATRSGFAFKWQDETVDTHLETIEWSCAVAAISPVAVFSPVQLEGTVVKRASLCNISECERLGIGAKGTHVTVIKSNKIIPKVVKVSETVGRLKVPTRCPVCGAPTEIRPSESGAQVLRCTNEDCAARSLRKFMRFVSKQGMDIDGLGGETLSKFIGQGFLKTVADVFRLVDHEDEIAAMEGFGEQSAANICAAIRKIKEKKVSRDAAQFLVALSIPLCGADVAKRLLGAYGVKELFAKGAEAAHPVDLFSPGADVFASIDGIGPGKSAAFVAWCADPAHLAVVDDLLAQVELNAFQAAPKTGACAGLTFVVTGDVHHYANRNALKAYIESQGGKVAGSVSKATSFLINNDAASTSGKNRKARELGIPVITEDEFLARFGV